MRHLIVPLAGKDPQFKREYKPFISINGKTLIQRILQQHSTELIKKAIFIVLSEHEKTHNVSLRLRQLFGNNISIHILSTVTKGAPCSIVEGIDKSINDEDEIIIELGDVLRDITQFYEDITEKEEGVAGILPVMKKAIADRPWGYVSTDGNNRVSHLDEKVYIKNSYATMGLYHFSHWKDFVEGVNTMIKNNSFIYNENFFVGPVYNELIKQRKQIIISENTIKNVVGTPEDIKNITL